VHLRVLRTLGVLHRLTALVGSTPSVRSEGYWLFAIGYWLLAIGP